jgi:hypothetical protein
VNSLMTEALAEVAKVARYALETNQRTTRLAVLMIIAIITWQIML